MPLPLPQAAPELGIAESTLRGWIAKGCPVAKRGGRGRGRQTLIDVDAVRAWKHGSDDKAALRAFAGRVPELLADAVYDAHRHIDGPHKDSVIAELPGIWYGITCAMLDEIRNEIPDIADPDEPPEKIARLLAILGRSGSIG